ncbi:MAG: cyclic nucleotide-binding domain-containing protein [Chromatiales bacterium]
MRELPVTIDLLRRIPIFAGLSDEQVRRMITSPANRVVDFGPMEDIIREGEAADCMYVILDGMVDVRIRAVAGREITIATLKAGEYFGEQALLPGASGRRNASVRSLQRAKLYRIAKEDVVLGYGYQGNVQQVDEENLLLDELDLSRMTDEERIKRTLRSNRLFRSLSDGDLMAVRQWARVVRFDAGAVVIREAEPGDSMYVVLEGTVEVFIVDDDGKVVVLATLTRGQYFGEVAMLLQGAQRHNANVRAATAVALIEVSKEFFRQLLRRDEKLMLALQTIGDAQRKKITEILGHPPSW